MLLKRIKKAILSSLISIFLLYITFIIIQYKLWLPLLYIFSGVVFIQVLIIIFKRFYIVDIFLLRFSLFVFPFSWYRNFILFKKFGLVSKKKIIHSKFHEIYAQNLDYMPLVIKLITKDPFLFKQLPPYAQKLFEYSKQHNYDFNSLQKIYGYYLKPPIEIAYRLGKGEKIEHYEKERLIYESSLQERLLIENNLPRTNPILREINKKQQITLESGFSIIK
ncbi:MAG: hypothetical protein K9W44_09270 [Candidatus Lokiarchaeota archaeon]|nr:hypothetical protein [Candidatus Harpocratesius repetitus]